MRKMTNDSIRELVQNALTNITESGFESHSDHAHAVLMLADWLTEQNDLDTMAIVLEEAVTLDEDTEQLEFDFEMPEGAGETYRLTTRGCDAGGYFVSDGFVVLEGSTACPDVTDRFIRRHPGSFALRNELIESGMIVEYPETNELYVVRDIWFESAAKAASVLSGTICGTDMWQPLESSVDDAEAF